MKGAAHETSREELRDTIYMALAILSIGFIVVSAIILAIVADWLEISSDKLKNTIMHTALTSDPL